MGTQYRSVIFYHTDEQRKETEAYIKELTQKKTFPVPIVTKLEYYRDFYPAEDFHLKYYEKNRNVPYSRFVITPKLDKLEKKFSDKLKG
jgi:peptide-methionine (S)-S-oxide reductase